MYSKFKNGKRAAALLLSVLTVLSLLPGTAFAAQQNSYHDPAQHWLSSSSRTNELDVNAVVTTETFLCRACGKNANFTVFRTPEYTKDGQTAMSRNVKFSDGTLVGGSGKGSILDGTPGVNAYYTGWHWTKAVCDVCGTINSNDDQSVYSYGKNIYVLFDCASEFTETLEDTVTYEDTDSTYHTKTTTGGTYCCFCYGTNHTTDVELEKHDLETSILPQPANGRFAVMQRCRDCGYTSYAYTAAKSVVANYYGTADGKPHTLTVTDLSEAGVTTQIRYGTSADACTLTSAPNYTEEGQYTVYYEITYTYKDTSMTENGVAYVWLHASGDGTNGSQGTASGSTCGGQHKFVLLDSVDPSCLTLGYDRYLCVTCGTMEKRDYTAALGHDYQSIIIREATCETDGKVLELCSRCGDAKVTTTPKGEHKYVSSTVTATCTTPGYTLKECSVCGDRHITDLTPALAHNYEAVVTPATCEAGGHTTHICYGCGSSFVTDHTAALGHDWDAGTKITSSSCTGEGVLEHHCTRCDATYLEAISAEGHTPGDPATCTTPQVCTKCGAVLVLPTGHTPSDWITDQEPTTDSEGSRHKECQDCGTILDRETLDKLTAQQEKHGAYIYGYTDGTFGPARNMTRAEATAIFARLLAEKNGDTITPVSTTKYEDIPANAWYSGYVKYLTNYGVIYGRTDSTFAPKEAITRAEFTAMAVRFFEAYGDGAADIMEQYKDFTDVSSGYWAAEYIKDAAIHGWILGYSDGTFRAESAITRAEVVTLVNRLLGRTADEDYLATHQRTLNTFPDLPESHWAYLAGMEAANGHIAVLGEGESWSK